MRVPRSCADADVHSGRIKGGHAGGRSGQVGNHTQRRWYVTITAAVVIGIKVI